MKGRHRYESMTEHNDSMSQQSSENQSMMDMPSGLTADPHNAHPSTVESPPFQEADQLREGSSEFSYQRLVDAYPYCTQEREVSQMENLNLCSEVEQLRQKVSELQGRLAEQESVVRDAQESAFALMASNISVAENDDKICSRLRMIRMQWKVFAKKWAAKNMAQIGDEKHVLIKKKFKVWMAPDEDQSCDGIWTIENNRKAPSILLNTALAHSITKKIVETPFKAAYGLKGITKSLRGDRDTIMNSLDKLYAIKMKGVHCEIANFLKFSTDMTQKTTARLINGGRKQFVFLICSNAAQLPTLRNHSKP